MQLPLALLGSAKPLRFAVDLLKAPHKWSEAWQSQFFALPTLESTL
jgi:hypothetical protein